VRIRHAMAAGSAVALLSAATTMMASATASAGVTSATAPAPVATVTQVGTVSYGSIAGLVLGLLFVLLLAAVSFAVRVRSGRRAPARTISVPEARIVRHFTPAFAD
jgi:hypothetical protein